MGKVREFFSNWSEIVWGAVYGLFCSQLLYLWCIPIALICGVLWRLGGMRAKFIRRFGVPLVLTASYAFMGLSWFLVAYFVLTAFVLSLGYGIPQKK